MELPGAKRLGDDRRPLGTLRCWRHSDIGPARGIVVTPALKEWSAAVHALLDGRQTVLLRKGGIGEKRFEVAAHEFLLFPTVAHSHAERVRPEHRDLLGPAAADSTDECVLLRAAAKVVAALPVNRPEGLDAIEDLHIWTAESVRADRLDFRPKHKLAVLVVSAIPLAEPVRLAVFAQLLLLPVAWYLIVGSHQPAIGIPVGIIALGVLVLLFSPPSIRWAAGRDQRGAASAANRGPDSR